MIAAALLLCLFLGVGILTRSYNTWTRLSMVLVIIGALVLFYLT
jgi:hypothetical protein